MRNLEEFNGAYEGKVFFIIGCGPSIHFQDLTPLKDYVTIAVNSGYCAFPEADFFISDDWSISHWSFFFRDLKNSKHTTALLYDDKLGCCANMFGDRSVLFKHREGYHITDKYEHDAYENRICQARSSLGSAIHVAHIMGAAKIILLGVDCRRLQNCRYFWQFPFGKDKLARKPYRNDGIPNDKYKISRNKGIETDTDLMAILEYWNTQTGDMVRKCDIYNASPHSILTVFTKIKLSDFLKEHGDQDE